MRVPRSDESPSSPQRSRPEWFRNLFIVAPLLMSTTSIYFFSIRHLMDAWTSKSAAIAEGDQIYRRLRAEGEEALRAKEQIGRQEYQRLVEIGKSDAAATLEVARQQGKATETKAKVGATLPKAIAQNFAAPIFGRNPEMARLSFEISKLRIGIANQVDFEGDIETLRVKGECPVDRRK